MGYKNLDHYDEFCNFLAACLEDLGYTVAEQCDEYIQVTDKNGKIKMITQADICIFMGYTAGNVVKLMEGCL